MGNSKQPHRRAERFINASQLVPVIQCPSQPQSPALYHPASKRTLKVRMVRSVTAIAQCDQVGGVIDPTGGTGNQMMNVGFALGACFAASSANVRVASENDSANGAPLLKLRLGRRKRHSVQLGNLVPLSPISSSPFNRPNPLVIPS